MRTRKFGRTGWTVSEVGFGAWQIGGAWGDVSEEDAVEAVNAALDAGISLFDTADVYGDGRSEQILAKVMRERRPEGVHVITKAGRRLPEQTPEGYNRENLTAFVDRSLRNLGVERLDLVQLHCPPTEVYYQPEVFGILDDLAAAGKIQFYGVSVEKVEQAIKAIDFPNVMSVQMIFNIFRQRPADLFFDLAKARNVAVLPRVPLASGLLTGKLKADTRFADDDHRLFNRGGEAFDVGETFAGVPYETGLAAVEKLRRLVPGGTPMAQWALRWILMHDAVSCVIPGARNRTQAESNAAASPMSPLTDDAMAAVHAIYEEDIKPRVHHRW